MPLPCFTTACLTRGETEFLKKATALKSVNGAPSTDVFPRTNRSRYHPDTWDWTKTNRELQTAYGCCYLTVCKWRKRLKKSQNKPPHDYESWDWSKRNIALAQEHGVSGYYVSMMRRALGKRKVTKWSNFDYSKLDFNLSNAALARQHKLPINCVADFRIRAGNPQPTIREQHPLAEIPNIPPLPDIDWEALDWTKADIVLSREINRTRERVRQMRAQLGKPLCSKFIKNTTVFLNYAKGKPSLCGKDAEIMGLRENMVRRYCKRFKIPFVFNRKYTPKFKQWPLMNWDIPQPLLAEIWRIKYHSIAQHRAIYGIARPKFLMIKGKYPAEFQNVIDEERKKAAKFLPAKQMPSYSEHCAESLRTFRRSYAEVHLWLDEFAERPPYGMKHRRLRHHQAGVEEVRKKWGDEAAAAAKQHILSDLQMEDCQEGQPFPRNETDYIRMGLL